MIAPRDIGNKEFKKVQQGYLPEEVDDFLDDVAISLQQLYHENIELEDRVKSLSEDAKNFDTLNSSIDKILELAEKTAEEIKEDAVKLAKQIEDDALAKQDEIFLKKTEKLLQLETDINKLQDRYKLMCEKIKLLIYAELELIDKNEIFSQGQENE